MSLRLTEHKASLLFLRVTACFMLWLCAGCSEPAEQPTKPTISFAKSDQNRLQVNIVQHTSFVSVSSTDLLSGTSTLTVKVPSSYDAPAIVVGSGAARIDDVSYIGVFHNLDYNIEIKLEDGIKASQEDIGMTARPGVTNFKFVWGETDQVTAQIIDYMPLDGQIMER